jgi:hypothetical protein
MSDIYLSLTETPSVVTLSQPVISGALSSTVTVANTVTVALDANSLAALENVTVTVGAAVSVSNFPASQTISGTVTANNTNLNRLVQNGETQNTFGVPIVYARTAGGELDYWKEVSQRSGLPVANQLNEGGDIVPFAISGTVTVGNTVTIAGTVAVNAGSAINWNTIRLSNYSGTGAVALNGIYKKTENVGYVDGGGSGTPIYEPIDGNTWGPLPISFRYAAALANDYTGNRWSLISDNENTFWASTTASNITSVTGWLNSSGAVTATVANFSALPVALTNEIAVNSLPAISGTVTVSSLPASTVTVSSLPAISGTITANLSSANLNTVTIGVRGTVTIGNSITISSIPSISGTVTANLSRPTWTNYSGSITTAGTAVTAISNTSRSYLLAQVTTGQMFLNIGATATTLNSVYFSAGQGFAWETVVPQGIVSVISTVTGTNYVLKEG